MAGPSLEDDYYKKALVLVREAGVMVFSAFQQPKPLKLETKTSAIDLVTETDKAVEEHLSECGCLNTPENTHNTTQTNM